MNEDYNLVPFSIFSDLSSERDHSMQIYGWDGFESSEPVTFQFAARGQPLRFTQFPRGFSLFGILQAALSLLDIRDFGKITGHVDTLLISFDERASARIPWPIGVGPIPVPKADEAYLTPGSHAIKFSLLENDKIIKSARSSFYLYKIVNRPVITVVGQSVVDESHEEITLPFEVLKENEDNVPVTMYYKFDDSTSWNILSTK
jgi:hypothetical protein